MERHTIAILRVNGRLYPVVDGEPGDDFIGLLDTDYIIEDTGFIIRYQFSTDRVWLVDDNDNEISLLSPYYEESIVKDADGNWVYRNPIETEYDERFIEVGVEELVGKMKYSASRKVNALRTHFRRFHKGHVILGFPGPIIVSNIRRLQRRTALEISAWVWSYTNTHELSQKIMKEIYKEEEDEDMKLVVMKAWFTDDGIDVERYVGASSSKRHFAADHGYIYRDEDGDSGIIITGYGDREGMIISVFNYGMSTRPLPEADETVLIGNNGTFAVASGSEPTQWYRVFKDIGLCSIANEMMRAGYKKYIKFINLMPSECDPSIIELQQNAVVVRGDLDVTLTGGEGEIFHIWFSEEKLSTLWSPAMKDRNVNEKTRLFVSKLCRMLDHFETFVQITDQIYGPEGVNPV